MKLTLSSLVGYTFVQLSCALEVFSDNSFGALSGVADDTCRGHLPEAGYWSIKDTAVIVSIYTPRSRRSR